MYWPAKVLNMILFFQATTLFAEMIKKKNLREKLQQRQNQKRDLKDGSTPGKGAPLPVPPVTGHPRSSEIQILDERANSAPYIQKPGAHPVRGVPAPSQQQSGPVPPVRSSQRGAPIANQNNLPGAAQPAHAQVQTPRGKSAKPPRPGTNLLSICGEIAQMLKRQTVEWEVLGSNYVRG